MNYLPYIITGIICFLIGYGIGKGSYSSGLVDGINMMTNIYRNNEKKKDNTTDIPWFHSMDTQSAVETLHKGE